MSLSDYSDRELLAEVVKRQKAKDEMPEPNEDAEWYLLDCPTLEIIEKMWNANDRDDFLCLQEDLLELLCSELFGEEGWEKISNRIEKICNKD